MSIKIEFECSGCRKKSGAIRLPRATFKSANGKGYGLGVWIYPTIADQAPEGWVAFDPYTHVTYCDECWYDIENDIPEGQSL